MQYLPRNIKIACNNSGLTHYGGIFFFQEFLRVLQFRRLLARHLPDFRNHHDYRLSQMTLALLYPIIRAWIGWRMLLYSVPMLPFTT